MDKNKKGVNIIIVLFVIFTLTILITTYFSNYYINEYSSVIQETVGKRLLIEARSVSKLISPKVLQEFMEPEDMEKPIYEESIQILRDYAANNDLMYVYFLRLSPNGMQQYILDSDPDPESQCDLNDFEEIEEGVYDAFMGKETYNSLGEYIEGWEGLISAFVPIYDEKENVIAVVGVDISDEEIITLKKQAEIFSVTFVIEGIAVIIISFIVIILYAKKGQEYNEASIAKSQFLSRMSHEIRTPMNAIIGFSRIAKKAGSNSEKNNYLQNIDSSSEYLLQLMNSILDISKIEEGKMVLEVEKASPVEMMRDIREMLSPQTKAKNQNFIMNIGKNIPQFVYCDKTHLTQVIVNLVSNSIKFTAENGEIKVTLDLLEKKNNACNLQFIIEDNGIGIDEQYLANIFEPFEQGSGRITKKYGGTGLGLAISKLFIEMMKGQVNVVSKVGSGTTFTFNVWLNVAPKGEETSQNEQIQTTIDCTGRKFLVVEDNEINQMIIENILKDFGADIEFANNGKEGLDKFLENSDKYDIIFMDIQMPIMDGFEATSQIRKSGVKNAKTIPIVATTAEVFKEEVNHVFEIGMNGHIGKPFKIEEIVKTIYDVLNKGD